MVRRAGDVEAVGSEVDCRVADEGIRDIADGITVGPGVVDGELAAAATAKVGAEDGGAELWISSAAVGAAW